MGGLELIVVLGVTVLVGTTLGGRYSVAPPVLLIAIGALLALLPPLSHVVLEPDVVLLLFLPAILYKESITTSLREIRTNLLAIALLAVGLVMATMVAVSLAAALAVPVTTPTGTRVHERDLIIFATAVVILLTMLIQGTTLPAAVVGWAGLVGDTRRVGELRLARMRATEAALAVLPEVADRLGAAPDAVDRIRADYEQHLDDVRSTDDESRSAEQARDLDRRLRLAVLEHKRREITRLRDTNEIDDIVLRELQAVLDIEEIRLLGPEVND